MNLKAALKARLKRPKNASMPLVSVRPNPVSPPLPGIPECKIPQTFVEFDVSPRCTRKCSFCAPGIPPARRAMKSIGLTAVAHLAVILQLRELGYDRSDRTVSYCGHGEPLMNPQLFRMIADTRKYLPNCRVQIYTNGDMLTPEMCCRMEVLSLDSLIVDLYDEKAAKRLPAIIRESSLYPGVVSVIDHVREKVRYSTRCSSVAKPSAIPSEPCDFIRKKLFVTDDGQGMDGWGFLTCCEDYARETFFKGTVAEAASRAAELRKKLDLGQRTVAPCSKCDRVVLNHAERPPAENALARQPIWTEQKPVLPKVPGDRLIIMPVSRKWLANALVVLDAIQRLSVMPGGVLVIWNQDDEPRPPAELDSMVRTVSVGKTLGWAGITAELYRAILAEHLNYDWIIKLDTDTAILRKGWDALVLNQADPKGQSGSYQDRATWEQGAQKEFFHRQLLKTVWGRRFVQVGLRGSDHIQGGFYVLGQEAVAKIERIAGFNARDQEGLLDEEQTTDDARLDTMCKLCRVPQFNHPLIRSTWGTFTLPLAIMRYWRDTLGVAIAHPVKNVEILKQITAEAY